MSDFTHSVVLFTGDDGLSLEFNVRNTNEKSHLKALIEHGGGICTQNENSVHLISPGTKVLNADLGKKLVSSSYIYDCVKRNYLLNVNEYVFTISEAQTSDISDEDSGLFAQRQSTCKSPKKNIPTMNVEVSPIKQPNVSNETTPSNLTLPSSNSAVAPICNSSESFVEGSQDNSTSYKITSHVYYGNVNNPANEKIKTKEGLLENSEEFNPSQSLVYPSNPKDLLRGNIKNTLNLSSPSKPSDLINVSPLNLCSPSKQADLINFSPLNLRSPSKPADLINISPLNLCSPSKPVELMNATRSLNLQSSSKQSDLLVDTVENTSILQSPARNIPDVSALQPTSPRNSMKTQKERIFSSPKKLIDISPIMRADTKKVNKNNINQRLELPVRNPFQEKTDNVLMEEECGENSERDTEINIDMNIGISLPGNQLLSSASPIKITDSCFESQKGVSNEAEMAHNASAVVSSSQPEDGLDNFDNMLLNKALHKPQSEDEESLSQTCTVSSSADAQVSSKPCSAEVNNTTQDNLPDSPNFISSQVVNEEEYIRNLAVEVQEILEKPPPRTIQDKITLVKYVCCVRKLTPKTVLDSLLTQSDSLDL
ncbi:uncharacterized protein [Parasteatoda tepidariorum]|uniref:uncharacterized protein n=1 Tax=Parasteatoda tepidariorum TaxID=114398 RepID=UPI001C7243A9|nr:sporozoite surface protein 2 [Parasteatoda tepidariorum]